MTDRYAVTRLHAVFAICLSVLFLSWKANAGTQLMLHGVFCNTERQIDDTVAHLRSNMMLEAAIAAANKDGVQCVLAKDIEYVVEGAVAIGEVSYLGLQFTKYEGSLVGVKIGTLVRPVVPPVKTFYVGVDFLVSAAKQSQI